MKKILIVSPHPDDACFSIGASIKKMSHHNFLVWNIFSDKNYSIKTTDNIEDTILLEELSAIKKMGANVQFANFEDAPKRGLHRLRDILGQDIPNSKLIDENGKLFNQISQALVRIINDFTPDWIGIPLGCGYHIDHLISREAVLRYIENNDTHKCRLFFYEDQPYSTNSNWYTAAIDTAKSKWTMRECKISLNNDIESKKNLISIYESQIKNRDIEAILKYAQNIGQNGIYERIWIIKDNISSN